MPEAPWRLTGDSAVLQVRLTPRSSRDGIEGVESLSDGRSVLKARVRAVPEDGKANNALVRLLAKALGCPVRNVAIIAGSTSRLKTVRIESCDRTVLDALQALAASS